MQCEAKGGREEGDFDAAKAMFDRNAHATRYGERGANWSRADEGIRIHSRADSCRGPCVVCACISGVERIVKDGGEEEWNRTKVVFFLLGVAYQQNRATATKYESAQQLAVKKKKELASKERMQEKKILVRVKNVRACAGSRWLTGPVTFLVREKRQADRQTNGQKMQEQNQEQARTRARANSRAANLC